MLARKTAGEIKKLYIIFAFLVSGNAADCINKTVVLYKDLSKGSLEDTLPNIPFEKFGNKYYHFGAINKGNFFQALQYCNYLGMTLLSIESKEENDFLWEKLKEFLGTGQYFFWTSGTLLPDGHWVWLTVGSPIVYTSWFPKQPDNSGNNEKCMEIRYQITNKAIMWNDVPCTIPNYIICETLQANCVANSQ